MESDATVVVEQDQICGCGDEHACAEPAPDERREGKGPDRRKERVDRRAGLDRRQKSKAESGYTGPERRTGDRRTSLERRRGPGRRLDDDRKSAEEGEMTAHQFEFVMAIQTYKKLNKRLYPTWTEILEIVNQLGYRKVLPRTVKLDTPEAPLHDETSARHDDVEARAARCTE